MRKVKNVLAPALVLAMALAIGACEVVDEDPTDPGGGTLPPAPTTTTTLDS